MTGSSTCRTVASIHSLISKIPAGLADVLAGLQSGFRSLGSQLPSTPMADLEPMVTLEAVAVTPMAMDSLEPTAKIISLLPPGSSSSPFLLLSDLTAAQYFMNREAAGGGYLIRN